MINDVLRLTRKRNCIDCTQLGGVIIPLVKIQHYNVWVYGCVNFAFEIIEFFRRNGVEIEGFIDRNIDKHESEVCGIKVCHTSYWKPSNSQNVLCIISVLAWEWFPDNNEIMSVLNRAGVDKFYIISEADKKEMCWRYGGWKSYFINHMDRLSEVYDFLADKRSQETMEEYIRAIITCEEYRGHHIDSTKKYFFDDDEYGREVDIFLHRPDEVWLNCGASIGDTIFNYFSLGLDAKLIYAYEGDKTISKRLVSNLKYLPDELRNKIIVTEEYINEKCDFSYIKEKITILNADIEGNELDMLKAIENRLISDRPVIAVCLYHKKEDLIEIPSFLKTILRDYKYYIRKYETSLLSDCITRTHELVLFGIPVERDVREGRQ